MNIKLKNKRIERGLTQPQLAKKSGITLRAYQYIEKDDRSPRADTAILIAEALKIKSFREFKSLFGAATPDNTKRPDSNRAES